MALRRVLVARKSQPADIAGLNIDHPLAPYVQSIWTPAGVILRDGALVTQSPGTPVAGPYGLGHAFNGTNQQIIMPSNSLVHNEGARIVFARIGAGSGIRHFSAGGGSSLGFRTNGLTLEVTRAFVNTVMSVTNAVVAGEYTILGCSYTVSGVPGGLGRGLFKNGVNILTSIQGVGVADGAYSDALMSSGANTQYGDHTLFAHFSFNRSLTAAEHAEVAANPWALFEPQRIWVPADKAILTVPYVLASDNFSDIGVAGPWNRTLNNALGGSTTLSFESGASPSLIGTGDGSLGRNNQNSSKLQVVVPTGEVHSAELKVSPNGDTTSNYLVGLLANGAGTGTGAGNLTGVALLPGATPKLQIRTISGGTATTRADKTVVYPTADFKIKTEKSLNNLNWTAYLIDVATGNVLDSVSWAATGLSQLNSGAALSNRVIAGFYNIAASSVRLDDLVIYGHAFYMIPSVLENKQTFFAPTVGTAQSTPNLQPPLLSNTQVFYVATVGRSAAQLQPTLLTNGQVFYAASASVSGATVQPPLLTNAQVFYGALVSGFGVQLQAPLLTNAQVFYAPTVGVSGITLQPPPLENAQVFYPALVQGSGAYVQPPLLENEQAFYDATLAVGSINLLASLFSNEAEFYAPVIGNGQAVVAPELFVNQSEFFEASVSPGTVQLIAPVFINDNEFYAPTLDESIKVEPSLFVNYQEFLAPNVTVGEMTVTPSLLTGTQIFYSPNVGDSTVVPITGISRTRRVTATAVSRAVRMVAPKRITLAQKIVRRIVL